MILIEMDHFYLSINIYLHNCFMSRVNYDSNIKHVTLSKILKVLAEIEIEKVEI